MDFQEEIKQLAGNIEMLKPHMQTEEATKNALIMPFIRILGYNVFNPLEVVPEMDCDIQGKKGEKIDYAIIKDNEPIMLIECKHWQQDLTLHQNQLLRYFQCSQAKFGILTNGIVYKFYTDLEKANIMDTTPFLELNLLDLKDEQITELKKFRKSVFDADMILSTASDLKYMGEFHSKICQELEEPSWEFAKLIASNTYKGNFTTAVYERFKPLIKRTINNYINDIISDRLNAALKDNNTARVENNKPSADVEENTSSPVEADSENKHKIITTEEEMEAYYIVKSIVREIIPTDRISFRDAQSYSSVFIDNTNRKAVCRFHFNISSNKKITIFAEEEKSYKISNIDEIYNYSEDIKKAAEKYL